MTPSRTFEEDVAEFEATIAGGRATDGLGVTREFAKALLARLRDLESDLAQEKRLSKAWRTGKASYRDALNALDADRDMLIESAETAGRELRRLRTEAGEMRNAACVALGHLHNIDAWAAFVERWHADRSIDPTDEVQRLRKARLHAHEAIVSITMVGVGVERGKV